MPVEFAFADDVKTWPAEGVRVADQQRWGHAWEAMQTGWEPVDLGDGDRCNGFAMAYLGSFAAIYASDGAVWLQIGERSWNAETILRVEQVNERPTSAMYRLVFVDGRSETVRFRMPADVALQRDIDPTSDEIASETDDLMKVFPYVAQDGWSAAPDTHVPNWVASVRDIWTAGIDHGP